MQVTNTDLIVLLRLKLPDVNWGNGDVPARAKWCYNIGLARSGCSIFWKPKGATKDTEVREYPIKVQIEAVNKGEHHSITAQHASTVGHGGTEGGGGTRDMTNWGVLDKTDIGGTHARQSGELLHNCIQQHNSHMGDPAPEGQGDYE